MKKTILLLMCIVSVLITNAQRPTPKKGDYLKSNYIDQFVGIWEWKSGNDSFTIKFRKVKHHYKTIEIDQDVLLGWFKYIKDGKLIENSIPDSSNTAVAVETQQHTLLVTFTDINTKKTKSVVMELISGDKRKAIWRVDPIYPQGITHENNGIPTGDKWEMVKIE